MALSRFSKFSVGNRLYYQADDGQFIGGEVTKVTSSCCTLKGDNGVIKRKSKHLLYETIDKVKLNTLKKADYCILQNFNMSIKELWILYREMIDQYPEKFI